MSTLVITEDCAGFELFHWENDKGVEISPKFPKKTLALEWFSMHEEWMEDSERVANLMYLKSNN